ncbi:hypothetical protein RBY4I_3774 [Rhodobacterales bacterium Y4I]|nr:hypothetical protein RBY4I_3774 [Rhodobacterales bacterium Y4I]
MAFIAGLVMPALKLAWTEQILTLLGPRAEVWAWRCAKSGSSCQQCG